MISQEQTKRNYDRMARWYDLFASSERKFSEIGLRMLEARRGERILEIGSGTGHALAELAHMVGETGLAVGLDLSMGMIKAAKKQTQAHGPECSARMLQGDALNLPFARGSFNGIFLSFTLELFSEAEIPMVLERCKHILNPGGRLGVVCMANNDALACRLYKWGHRHWPTVLDCRPIQAEGFLVAASFSIRETRNTDMWGLPVDILLAEKTISGQVI